MSRTMRFLGIPAAGFALTFFFIFIGFPWELLGQRAVTLVETGTGYEVAFDELDPYMSFVGPGFQATELQIVPRASARPLRAARLQGKRIPCRQAGGRSRAWSGAQPGRRARALDGSRRQGLALCRRSHPHLALPHRPEPVARQLDGC